MDIPKGGVYEADVAASRPFPYKKVDFFDYQ
jgi:hypothetical protein